MYKVHNPYLTAAVATMGGMLFGFDISSVSAFVGEDNYMNYFGHPTSFQQGGITASMAGGSMLSCAFAGYISDRVGRKPTIQFAAAWWMVGASIQCSAQNMGQLIAGRAISGLGIGLGSSQIPVFISELSPKKIRGRLVGCFQWSVTWGILIMFYISFGCSYIKGHSSFRLAWGIQLIPGAMLAFGMMLLDESPRWLASKDRWEEAIQIIRSINANYGSEEDILMEIEDLREVVRIDHESKSVTIWDLFRKDSINRTMVGVWAQIWQQLTGMNIMMYYVVIIFKMAGYSGKSAVIVSGSIQYIINVVMTIPALLFIDKIGRRPLLICGSMLMATWLLAVGGMLGAYGIQMPQGLPAVPSKNQAADPYTTIYIPDNQAPARKAIIACCYLFVASFAPTWGPGIWLYCSEIFPNKQRALANSLTAGANWGFNFALALFVPTAFKNINWKVYIIFGVFCIVMSIHVFLLFPETKGKSLEVIDQMWDARVPAWKTASWVPDHMPSHYAGDQEEKPTDELAEAPFHEENAPVNTETPPHEDEPTFAETEPKTQYPGTEHV
ncbi:YALIA101S04e15874g1_1 [Yarrowia lipolytica]|uniref:General substrate transporter n=1 Tax=Yarrowia lipolytica TaxID=4952 RepID=A0A371C6E4_YARLL|nr:High-affinity glucose transporter [Yarrowia lipolytica]RDW25906.1 general substrate transporter [Yarrowia lipolytica]SEI34315.1 YALIA101S04e15874g1_1 [Yarrowia lipolytica]VBB89537.1 High-affinity glucose transporter, putative [Yarrowia lipolytica]